MVKDIELAVKIEKGKVLLINPKYRQNPFSSRGRHALTPAIGLPLIAAATPEEYEVQFVDENIQRIKLPTYPIPEVVGISVHTAFVDRALEFASQYRKLGSKVVLGGPHITAIPEMAQDYADVLVVGDGVPVWPKVLSGLRQGTFPKGTVIKGDGQEPHYSEFPWPRRDILPKGAFLTQASVVATRGCPNQCNFCYLSTKNVKSPYQKRRISDVLAEIDAIGERYVVFTDNNLTADPKYAFELCRELKSRRVIWSAAVTVDAAKNPALVKEMAASGCQGVFVGFETLQDSSLIDQKKYTLRPSTYKKVIQCFHDYGIEINGSFVFGFDEDGPEVFDQTLAFINENKLECATFQILTPYPGTPLFARLEKEGRILTTNWELYDTAHVVYRPARMEVEELLLGYQRIYKELYSWSSVWKRRPNRSILGDIAYLAMTGLYKKWDWIWKLIVPWGLTHSLWAPLVFLHHKLAWSGRLGKKEFSTVQYIHHDSH